MEAGEIENALMSIDGVDEAIVLLRKDLDGPDSLCAYVKLSSAVLDGGANLKANLVLPKYMVPPHSSASTLGLATVTIR